MQKKMTEIEANHQALSDKVVYMNQRQKEGGEEEASVETFEIMIHKVRKEFRQLFVLKDDSEGNEEEFQSIREEIKALEEQQDKLEADCGKKVTYSFLKDAIQRIEGKIKGNKSAIESQPINFIQDGNIDNATVAKIVQMLNQTEAAILDI